LTSCFAPGEKAAARRYFEKAIAGTGVPETVTIDRSGANLTALNAINADREMPIKIRQSKYLNNVVEQDHRAIKLIVRPIPGFKSFRCARVILGGIELMQLIAKGQMKSDGGRRRSVAEQFYDLAKYASLAVPSRPFPISLLRQNLTSLARTSSSRRLSRRGLEPRHRERHQSRSA
jgi:putative transposase